MQLSLIHSLLSSAILIIGLASKPTTYHPLYFLAGFSIFLYILATPYPDDDPGIKYQIGLGTTSIASAFDFLVLSNPQESARRNGDTQPASQRSYPQRLKWAGTLFFNIRNANWTDAAPNLIYPTSSRRVRFVLLRLRQAAFYFMFADAVAFFTRRMPSFQYPPTESMGAHGFAWQAVNVVLFWCTLVGYMGLPHTILSAAAVGMGIADPEDWPAYFGKWLETTSVRAFWGKTWHQSLRRSVQPQAKYLAQNILHLRRGLLSRYIQLFTCFFISGLIHAAGDWVMQRNPDYPGDIVKYFVLQSVIITLEDFLIFLGKNVGIKSVPRVTSYVWVLMWMSLTGPLWLETNVKGGVFVTLSVPREYSIVDKFFG